MNRLFQFGDAVRKKWGGIVTSGTVIGFLGIWQGIGHTVDPWVYAAIAGVGLVASFFRAWEEQIVRAEAGDRRILELQGRPELTLACEQFQPTMSDPPEWGSGSGRMMHRFRVRNDGSTQAVNVTIEDIPLPMSEFIKRAMDDEVRALEKQTGEKPSERRPGWDVWTIKFAKLTSVGIGQESVIRFIIDNMSPLQGSDLCYCLGGTVRAGTEPHRVRLTLRFSNRDGSTWVQTYTLEHRFTCHLSLAFVEVKPVHATAGGQSG